MSLTLGYWDIRGLAHAIRLLLEYTETPYEDKQYHFGEAPDFDTSQWTSVKEKLGLDFPNMFRIPVSRNPKLSLIIIGNYGSSSPKHLLPYLFDGERKLTQSNAILRYIARKHKMCGETEEEKIRIDILENQFMDFRMHFARMCYSPDFEKLKPEFIEQLPEKLKLFSQFLGDRKWFTGNKITYVDFIAYDVLDRHLMFQPKCLDQFRNLKDFLDRFEALEKISAYIKSGRFLKTPVFLRNATWGSKKE